MSETHQIEQKGLQILGAWLAGQHRTCERSHNQTFDLIVDGEYAELKTKAKGWESFDFLSLTSRQKDSLGAELKRIFLVLNVSDPENAQVCEIDAVELMRCKSNTIVHYEWNKGAIRELCVKRNEDQSAYRT